MTYDTNHSDATTRGQNQHRLRIVIFLLLLAFMAYGPFYRQILGGDNTLFRPWIMYKGKGVGIIDARFTRRHSDGSETTIDRFKLLGYTTPRQSPNNIYKIKNGKALRQNYRAICRAYRNHADIRVYARIMTRAGWRQMQKGSWNVCAGGTAR